MGDFSSRQHERVCNSLLILNVSASLFQPDGIEAVIRGAESKNTPSGVGVSHYPAETFLEIELLNMGSLSPIGSSFCSQGLLLLKHSEIVL